jgi:hypothetical protein
VSARALEGDPVSVAAHRDVRNVRTAAVDGHKPVDRDGRLRKQRLDTAQIAQPLLADVGHEGDRTLRPHTPGAERARKRHQDCQAAAVVADPGSAKRCTVPRYLDVGFRREHRIEMRGNHQVRPLGYAAPFGDDVASLVHADALQASAREGIAEHLGTCRFVERRRWHLAEPDLIRDRLRFAGAGAVEGGFDFGPLGKRGDAAGRLRQRTATGRGQATEEKHQRHRDGSERTAPHVYNRKF